MCSSGFTGEACETCAEGHWGPKCLGESPSIILLFPSLDLTPTVLVLEDCASHCDSGACSDGLEGNGQCTATVLANSTSSASVSYKSRPSLQTHPRSLGLL